MSSVLQMPLSQIAGPSYSILTEEVFSEMSQKHVMNYCPSTLYIGWSTDWTTTRCLQLLQVLLTASFQHGAVSAGTDFQ